MGTSGSSSAGEGTQEQIRSVKVLSAMSEGVVLDQKVCGTNYLNDIKYIYKKLCALESGSLRGKHGCATS